MAIKSKNAPKMNPCASLRKPGIKGERNILYEAYKIFESPEEIIEIRVAQVEEGAWDYGFAVRLGELANLDRKPGGNNGWFEEKWQALLFGLQAIRIAFKDSISKEALKAIIDEITKVSSPTLFATGV